MLSVVIPAHDEAENLPTVISQVEMALASLETRLELIVVDDGSKDQTWQVLKQLTACRRENILRAIRFSRNFGKESAILAGLSHAHGDAVVVMDADLQHPPALLPVIYQLWLQGGYSIVEVMKRERQRETLAKRLSATIYYRLLMLSTQMDLRNSTDFKLLDRRAVSEYLRLPESSRFFRGLTAWIGLPTARVEVAIPDRVRGASSWKFRNLLGLARRTIISFSALPLQLITWFGLLGLCLSVVLTLQTLWNKLFATAAEGFPTVIILVLLMGSLILTSLGIIGEYLSELYVEVKRRPPYVLRDSVATNSYDQNPPGDGAT